MCKHRNAYKKETYYFFLKKDVIFDCIFCFLNRVLTIVFLKLYKTSKLEYSTSFSSVHSSTSCSCCCHQFCWDHYFPCPVKYICSSYLHLCSGLKSCSKSDCILLTSSFLMRALRTLVAIKYYANISL